MPDKQPGNFTVLTNEKHDANNAGPGPQHEDSRRPVRSFVRREGRITKGQQRALDSLLPVLGVDHIEGPLNATEVFGRKARLTVEIGFGNGTSLVEMARVERECNFLGVEVYRPGVGKLLLDVERENIDNIRVSTLDAHELIENRISENSVDRILIFFPDPWPKKKHLKRRLIQADFVEVLASRLTPAGILHVATDIESYAHHAMEVLEGCTRLRNTSGAGSFTDRPAWRPVTKYELRGTRLGHSVFDLVYDRA